MCQFLDPLKSSNFDPRTYLRPLLTYKHVFGNTLHRICGCWNSHEWFFLQKKLMNDTAIVCLFLIY